MCSATRQIGDETLETDVLSLRLLYPFLWSSSGPVVGLVGIEGGVVSGVINLEIIRR